jgi:hypothetical protein
MLPLLLNFCPLGFGRGRMLYYNGGQLIAFISEQNEIFSIFVEPGICALINMKGFSGKSHGYFQMLECTCKLDVTDCQFHRDFWTGLGLYYKPWGIEKP